MKIKLNLKNIPLDFGMFLITKIFRIHCIGGCILMAIICSHVTVIHHRDISLDEASRRELHRQLFRQGTQSREGREMSSKTLSKQFRMYHLMKLENLATVHTENAVPVSCQEKEPQAFDGVLPPSTSFLNASLIACIPI